MTSPTQTAAWLLAALLLPVAARSLPQQESNSDADEPATVSVKIKVTAEGKSSLPSGSKIEWKGAEESCKGSAGRKNLETSETTRVSLPVCKVRLLVFITGFETKAVTVDLAANEDKVEDPIRITVKHQGPAEVDW